MAVHIGAISMMVVTLVLPCFGQPVTRTLNSTKFEIEMVCEQAYGTVTGFYTNLQTSIQCAAKCGADPTCLSVIYNPITRGCAKNNAKFTTRTQTGCAYFVLYAQVWTPPVDCGQELPNGQLTSPGSTLVNSTYAYTCTPLYYPDEATVTCQASGFWGPGKCYPLATDLNNSIHRIVIDSDGRWWHYDPSTSTKRVTVLWQPNDNFVRFRFIEVGTGLYKLQSVADGKYMYDNGNFLDGLNTADDDNQRFIVYRETNTTYRILTKSTGSYVRMDEDLHISSELNLKDTRSLYRLTDP